MRILSMSIRGLDVMLDSWQFDMEEDRMIVYIRSGRHDRENFAISTRSKCCSTELQLLLDLDMYLLLVVFLCPSARITYLS